MSITLKAARINKKLTLEEAAKLIGVNKFTLANYERGKTSPTVEIVRRIEKVYGLPYAQIIF